MDVRFGFNGLLAPSCLDNLQHCCGKEHDSAISSFKIGLSLMIGKTGLYYPSIYHLLPSTIHHFCKKGNRSMKDRRPADAKPTARQNRIRKVLHKPSCSSLGSG